MIGKTLAHYEILALIGRGGMGEVYLARDTKLDRDVAIKILPAELANDPQRRARFEREARAVAALNHPNVVTIHAVEEAEGQLFLVMEWVQGVTLTRKIPGGGVPLREFFQLALSLSEAVSVAHSAGITHRDLKPENVMVDDSGRLKVLDFGLAKVLETADPGDDRTIAVQTREGVILGTTAYMSPEQAEGKPTDARSDVFTIGILFYEMLTGRRPFGGDTHMSTLTSVLRDDPVPVVELRPELPREFQRIVRRCLEKDPDRRYETARGIQYDLEVLREEILRGEYDPGSPIATVAAGGAPVSRDPMLSGSKPPTGSIPPSSASQPGIGPGRRNPLWVFVPFVLVVVLAVFWFQRPRGDDEVGRAQPEASVEDPVVVVFPFQNLGPPEDAYFADGITDEITTRLTSVRGLRVLARSSATQYDRENKSMAEIVADLGVDYVLEGAVRWQRRPDGPSRVRVTTQLVDAAAGVQVWAEPFDRDMDEIFAVQEEIAGQVVQRMGVEVSGSAPTMVSEGQPTDNIEAYHLYLRAYHVLTIPGTQSLEEIDGANALLEQAVALDSTFAEAWGLLARGNASIVHFGWDQSEERIEKSRLAMERGLALDPENVVVQLGKGYYYYHGLKDYAPALDAFERAGEIQPGNPEIMSAIGYVLRRQGRADEALDRLYRASELMPNDGAAPFDIGQTLVLLRRFPEALVALEQARLADPTVSQYCATVAEAHLLIGEVEAARKVLASFAGQRTTEFHLARVRTEVLAGDFPAALAYLEELPELYVGQYFVFARDTWRAWLLRAMDIPERVPEAADEALAALARLEGELGEHSNLVSAMAVARSLLGPDEAEAAESDARRAVELYPASRDVWIRTYRQRDLALVLMNAGDYEEAVRQLAIVISGPAVGGVTSAAELGASPLYATLRGRADFEALLRDQK